MISKNTAGGALSAGFLSAIEQPSREWRTRLVDANGDQISCEIMSFTIHKGTRGKGYAIGTLYAPYFEVSITGYTGTLLGQKICIEIAPVITKGTEPTEYARLCTGEIFEAVQAGDAYAIKCAGVLSLKGDLVLTSESMDVATVISAIETLIGVAVVAQGSVATIGLTGTLAQSMKGLTVRTALQELATFFGGFVSEDASGDVLIGSTYSGTAYEITGEMVQEEPEETGSLEITGFSVVTQAGGEDAQGQVIPADAFVDGTSVFYVFCPYMTQTQFDRIKGYVTGQMIYGGTVKQAVGNPLLEPWDHITAGNSVFVGAGLTITDAVSVDVHSEIVTAEEKPAVQVGPMQARIEEMQEALYTIQDGQQYFWVDANGAHVTTIPKDQFLARPSGGNTTIDSSSIRFKSGDTNLADFGTTGASIGREGELRFFVTPRTIALENDLNEAIFSVMEDASGNIERNAILATFASVTDIDTATRTVSDSLTATGTVTVTFDCGGSSVVLDNTQATTSVAVGSGVTVALTQAGVDDCAEIMTSAVDPEDPDTQPSGILSASYFITHFEKASLDMVGQMCINGQSEVINVTNTSWTSSNKTDTYVGVENTGTGGKIYLGIGGGSTNRGVYDKSNGWLVYVDSNNAAHISSKAGARLDLGTAVVSNKTTYVKNNQNALFSALNTYNGEELVVGSWNSGAIGMYDNKDKRNVLVRNGTNVYMNNSILTVPDSGAAVFSVGLRVQNHDSIIGTVIERNLASAVSLPNNTSKAILSQSIPAGTWVITCRVRFPSNATGRRVANLSQTSGDGSQVAVLTAINGAVTTLTFTEIVSVSSATTYYLNAYQNSGGALSMPAGAFNQIRAVRIA